VGPAALATAVLLVLVVVLGLTGHATTTTTATSTFPTTTTTGLSAADLSAQAKSNALAVAAGCPSSPTARVNTLSWKTAPSVTIDTNLPWYAHFSTTAGSFVVELNAKAAPITVNNFVFLAEHKFYNCVSFHRVIPGFVIQGGDPTGTGEGTPGYTIADEYPAKGSPTYPLYSVAMANTGQPHTGGSQFFIVVGPSGETLAATYSLFGKVVSGTKTLSTIASEGNPTTGVPDVEQRMLTVTINHVAN
jgi:cyclophilin family peptidyl-prolyl cis-trans isomerase